jgi:hypothetical protein
MAFAVCNSLRVTLRSDVKRTPRGQFLTPRQLASIQPEFVCADGGSDIHPLP